MCIGEGLYNFTIQQVSIGPEPVQDFQGVAEHQVNWDVVLAICATACWRPPILKAQIASEIMLGSGNENVTGFSPWESHETITSKLVLCAHQLSIRLWQQRPSLLLNVRQLLCQLQSKFCDSSFNNLACGGRTAGRATDDTGLQRQTTKDSFTFRSQFSWYALALTRIPELQHVFYFPVLFYVTVSQQT